MGNIMSGGFGCASVCDPVGAGNTCPLSGTKKYEIFTRPYFATDATGHDIIGNCQESTAI